MIVLIIIALALVLGASWILVAENDPGFVLLQYGSWSIETSLVIFVLFFIVLLIAGYMTLRSVFLVKNAPKRMSRWTKAQRKQRASQALTRGLISLEEGRWAEAERLFIRHASNSETPLLHYLSAARAAQKLGADERCDNYLQLAHDTTEGADIAVGMVQANLQINAGNNDQALATLQHLREISPKHPYVLDVLQKLYREMEQWQDVKAVLPDLRKRHVLPNADMVALDNDTNHKQLLVALEQQDWTLMDEIWAQADYKARQVESFLVPYVKGLIIQEKLDLAVELIERFMVKEWSDELVSFYGQIQHGESLKRLAKIESWLVNRQDNVNLLLAAGRLAKTNQIWSKAEQYLSNCIEHQPSGDAYNELAEVFIEQGQEQKAAECYKQGFTLLLNKTN
jgi:HemY protein